MSHTLKSPCSTRWSYRADSTKALKDNYRPIRDTLAKIATGCNENTQTKREAAALVAKLDKLETVMTVLWDKILGRFKATSDHLQENDMDLATALGPLQSLHTYVGSLRNQFAELEESACSISATKDYRFDI